MDDKRIDLKAALRELAAEESGKAGPHVGSKRLIAYRQGTLPAEEREAVQEHLSLCPRCAGLLLELRNFEMAAAEEEPGPEPLRTRRIPLLLYAAAAALLLAVLGLSFWAFFTVQQSRQQLAGVERRLEEREAALAETERQLEAARGQSADRVEELEARVAELTSDLEELRKAPPAPAGERIATVEVSTAPRFVLRGQEPSDGLLQGKGVVNTVQLPAEGGRILLALSLAGHPIYGEYRLELVKEDGEVLWSGRRPGRSLLGDAGTSVSVNGLKPGTYRLRVEGLSPERTELLGEYVLRVEGG